MPDLAARGGGFRRYSLERLLRTDNAHYAKFRKCASVTLRFNYTPVRPEKEKARGREDRDSAPGNCFSPPLARTLIARQREIAKIFPPSALSTRAPRLRTFPRECESEWALRECKQFEGCFLFSSPLTFLLAN